MMDREMIFKKIRAIGRAALTLDIENSHSGNISLRVTDESGNELLAITATGSQKGELTRDKICYPALNKTNFGYFKASSETDIHARILQIPGVNATVHGHTRLATVFTLDDAPMPKENARQTFLPVDQLGIRHLVSVPVDWFPVASGSKEMTDTLCTRLTDWPASIVQAHGVFAKGTTLEEAFFYLCMVEYSGEIALHASMIGLDMKLARANAEALKPSFDAATPDYSSELDSRVDFADEPDTVDMFLSTGRRIFESRYSPYHTGSMSMRGSTAMMYLPKASMPYEIPGPMLELPLKATADELTDSEMEIHRYVYEHTPFKAVMHCHVAEPQVMALAAMQDGFKELSKVIPIDAEGGFLYPAVPVLPPNPDPATLCHALMEYRVVIVAFGGVWSSGEQSISEAMRHTSSIKDICYYRIMAQARGLNISAMEPARARNW